MRRNSILMLIASIIICVRIIGAMRRWPLQPLQRLDRAAPKDAKIVQHHAMVRLVLLQQAVAVQQAGLVVEEHQQRAGPLSCQIVRWRRHNISVPLVIVQIVHHTIQIRNQIVEHNQIRPLRQLHQLPQHRSRPLAILIRCAHDALHIDAIQMPRERPKWRRNAGRLQIGQPLRQHDGPLTAPLCRHNVTGGALPLRRAHVNDHSRTGRQIGDIQQTAQIEAEQFALDLVGVLAIPGARSVAVVKVHETVLHASAAWLDFRHDAGAQIVRPSGRLVRPETGGQCTLDGRTPEDVIVDQALDAERRGCCG